jgi:hypothetical protein
LIALRSLATNLMVGFGDSPEAAKRSMLAVEASKAD